MRDRPGDCFTKKFALSRADTEILTQFPYCQPQSSQTNRAFTSILLCLEWPVYATSLINSPMEEGDNDIDGVIFDDMPWVLSLEHLPENFQQTRDHIQTLDQPLIDRIHDYMR